MSNKIITHGSFFTGIRGFDIAAERCGFKNIFTCEIDSFCRDFINYDSPNTFNHDNIDTFPFKKFKNKIDIISGGDPCQPHSLSGLRNGADDDRYKWPKMLQAIKVIQPTWVINENVIGTISNMVLDKKISDLENIGYSWKAFNIPIVDLNSDHERKRIFLIAHSQSSRHKTVCSHKKNSNKFFEEKIKKKATTKLEWNGLYDLCPVNTEEFEERMDQPTITTEKNGLPYRINNKFLKAAGNLVSPGIAYIIFNIIKEIESKNLKL